jgi:hypothetical protein
MPRAIPREAYAAMFGPTTGDRLRLADTELYPKSAAKGFDANDSNFPVVRHASGTPPDIAMKSLI